MVLDESVRAWVAAACGAAVLSSTPMAGGAGSTVDEVKLVDGRSVILRRVPLLVHVPNHRPSDEIRNEATALRLLDGVEWAPRLIAADEDGVRCGVAASIQTVLPGQVEVRLGPTWIGALAEAIHAVADVNVCADAMPAFDPWIDPMPAPPDWTSARANWRRAAELVGDWRAQGTHLIHRDLHPGNVLIEGGRLGGIVDWVHARVGPIEADLSRCRVEVGVLAGLGPADQLLEACVDLAPDYDLRWDLLVALELAPWTRSLLGFNKVGARLDLPTIHARLDLIVADALQRLA